MQMESVKAKRTTNRAQFKEMVEQMKTQPDIAKNYTKQSPELVHHFWENLTETLNSLGPPIKETSEWKKVWSDFKSSIKKKLANNKRDCEEMFFTNLEEEVIQLVCLRDFVEGVPQTKSYGMPKKLKLEVAESPPSVSPPICSEDNSYCLDILPKEEEESDIAHEYENSQNLAYHATSKKRPTAKASNHTQLLEEQIDLQKKLYEKVSDVLNQNVEQANNLNINIGRMWLSLERLGEHQETKNNILQSLLEETKRHNRRMEKLVIDKQEYLSDSISD